MRLNINLLLSLVLILFSLNAWSRGGGGCFERGTLISTPNGLVAIEKLKVGDQVYSRDKTKQQIAKVIATTQITPDHYNVIKLKQGELHVTDEHLIAISLGVYRRAASLTTNDKIIVWKNQQWQSTKIIEIKHIKLSSPAYNILVDNGSTFIANNALVHNKGCFLPETLILLANGKSIPISQVHSGDQVEAYEVSGKLLPTTVRNVLKHSVTEYYKLTTNKVVLKVTGEHPFYVGNGTFKTVETLSVGDTIYGYDGDKLSQQHIVNIQQVSAIAIVYNLQTDDPHTYFAAGIAVHNKGGGGGGHGGWGSGRGCREGDIFCQIFSLITLFVFVIISLAFNRKKKTGDLDYLNSRANIERKSIKTMKLLNFIAKQDVRMLPATLIERTREVFSKLQVCWVNRNYSPMQQLMMPDLYSQHCRQIQGMIQNHEINLMKELRIDCIDIVNIRYTEKEYQREFTALITAKVADYYVDDRNNQYLRGNITPQPFQEFWTFELEPGGWLLRDIEQSRESDYLKEENFVEMFTDLQIEKIYGDNVDNLGKAGPWLPKAVSQKENKVDRMLNFLSMNDKCWDRQRMIIRVRSIFTSVHLALEAGKLDEHTESVLFPDVAKQLQERLSAWRLTGNAIEYRNFCIRKVEIVLVKSFDDKSQNEFTARVSAHAQIIHLRNGNIVSQDNDVTLFVEYWVFGLFDGEWRLKDAKPESENDILKGDNIEEGSSPNLVKWYYTQKRAL